MKQKKQLEILFLKQINFILINFQMKAQIFLNPNFTHPTPQEYQIFLAQTPQSLAQISQPFSYSSLNACDLYLPSQKDYP